MFEKFTSKENANFKAPRVVDVQSVEAGELTDLEQYIRENGEVGKAFTEQGYWATADLAPYPWNEIAIENGQNVLDIMTEQFDHAKAGGEVTGRVFNPWGVHNTQVESLGLLLDGGFAADAKSYNAMGLPGGRVEYRPSHFQTDKALSMAEYDQRLNQTKTIMGPLGLGVAKISEPEVAAGYMILGAETFKSIYNIETGVLDLEKADEVGISAGHRLGSGSEIKVPVKTALDFYKANKLPIVVVVNGLSHVIDFNEESGCYELVEAGFHLNPKYLTEQWEKSKEAEYSEV